MTLIDSLFLLLLITVLLWLAILLFRHGSRRQFVSSMPIWRLLWVSVGLQLFDWLVDWLTTDPEPRPLPERLASGAFVFAVAAIIWLAGLFYGRWRESRRDGVLKSR